MSINNLSTKEFLNLSSDEQQKILSQLQESSNKYNELRVAKNLAETYKNQQQIKYDIMRYDGFVNNIKNCLYVLTNNEGYNIFMSDKELNDVEEYGLIQLMVNSIRSHDIYDIDANIYTGYQYNEYKDCIDIYHNYESFDIRNIKNKLKYNLDLTKYKYAYALHYNIICNRKAKSLLWRIIHKRKCNINIKCKGDVEW